MKKHGKMEGALRLSTGDEIDFVLPIILFEEDGATIAYCPALDLSGYGKSEVEAIDSYKYIMSEYFEYTTKKRTLFEDLKALGWKIKNSSVKKRFTPPAFDQLLEKNDNFKRVFNELPFKKINTPVRMPVYA